MKKLDKNQKIAIISLAIFVIFLIGFFALGALMRNGTIPDFTADQRVQGALAFAMFLPIFVAVFFFGRHFNSEDNKIGIVLMFLSVFLFAFGLMQAILSIAGVYGS